MGQPGSPEPSWEQLRSTTSPLGLGAIAIDRAHLPEADTVLVRDGVPAALIVTGSDSSHQATARRLNENLAARTGCRLPVVRDSDVVPGGSPALPPGRSAVALGTLDSNRLVAQLYHRRWIACDAAFPGPGGWLTRTVADPWGTGANVVVAAAGDGRGVEAAVAAVTAALQSDGGTCICPPLRDTHISGDFRGRYPEVAFTADAQTIEAGVAEAERAHREGQHRGITPNLAHAGVMYHLTGDDGFALLYRRLFKMLYRIARTEPGGSAWSAWGRAADFQSSILVPSWYLVETASVFTDEDRHFMVNHLLEYLYNNVAEVQLHRPLDLAISRNNHYTFAAIGLLFGAQYFQARYDWHEVPAWLQLVDECFAPQLRSWKATEDCNSYQWLTLFHTLQYALARPAPGFLEGGYARRCIEHGILTMDNLGYQVPFGDCPKHQSTWSEIPFFKATAWALGDAAYAGVLERKQSLRPPHQISSLYPVGFEYDSALEGPRDDSRFSGVHTFAVDPTFAYTHRSAAAPPQHAFDKLCFRNGTSPEDDYLLLDGISTGSHNHLDGNAILRLTAAGRIWLADADYMKKGPRFHNTLVISRDGVVLPPPGYVDLQRRADLGGWGYAATRSEDGSGAVWLRHVFWRPGRWFTVVDEVLIPGSQGRFDLRGIWRSVGVASLSDADFEVKQAGRRLRISTAEAGAGSVRRRLLDEPQIWGDWDAYEHADGTGIERIFEREVTREAGGSGRVVLASVLAVVDRCQVTGLQAAAEDRFTFSTDSDAAAFGVLPDAQAARTQLAEVRAESGDWSPVTGSVQAWHLDGDSLFAAAVRELELPGLQISAASPVDLVVASGQGRLLVEADAGFEMDGRSKPAGSHDLPLPAVLQLRAVAPGRAGAPATSGPAAGGAAAPEPPVTWRWQAPAEVSAVAFGCGLLAVGCTDGTLAALRDGHEVWRASRPGRVRAVCIHDLETGSPQVLAGGDDECVSRYAGDGSLSWECRLPYYEHDPYVRCLTVARLAGGGVTIMAGSNGSRFYGLHPEGRILWHYEVNHGASDSCAADVDGDGNEEVFAATEWNRWHCIGADGSRRWEIRPASAPGANQVCAADVDGDGELEAVFAGLDGSVHVRDGRTGEERWTFPIGDEVTGVASGHGGGVIAGAANGWVFALDGAGHPRWQVSVDSPVRRLCTVGEALAVGTADRGVVFLRDGQVSARWPQATPVTGLVVGAGGIVATTADGAVAALAVPAAD